MKVQATLVAGMIWLATTAQAVAAPTLRAGEWETRNDAGAHLVCEAKDHTFDRATLDKIFAMTGAKCTAASISEVGPAVHYDVVCEIGGGHMTVHSTIVATGPDAYTSRSVSHYEGGSIKIPDMDMTNSSRRLGPCRPGDRPSPF